MTAHTPGPWRIEGDLYDKRLEVFSKGEGYPHAWVDNDDIDPEIARANAALIAAAPEMFEMLEALMLETAGLFPDLRDRVHKVLRKARGDE